MSTAPQTGTVEPFRFEDGALLVLDQRALPAEERWIRCETPEQVADCIRTLAVRGAPAIGLAAAYAMALADDREAAAALLRSTRPTAVNLAWALEQSAGADDPLDTARRLHREQHEADRRMAELGAELFGDGTRALTHCNTGALATGGIGTACGVLIETVEQVADCIRTLAVRGAPGDRDRRRVRAWRSAGDREAAAAELLRATRPHGGQPRAGRSSRCLRRGRPARGRRGGSTASSTRRTGASASWERSCSTPARARSPTATPARSPPAGSAPPAGCCGRPGSGAGSLRCGSTRRARCCRARG